MKKQGLKTLNDLLMQSAELYADGIALAVNDTFLTFNQLNVQATQIAALLQTNGIKPGDHIAILSENSPQWGTAFFGIVKAGAVVVSLDVLNSQNELAFVLSHCEAKICFVSKSQKHKLDSLKENIPSIQQIFVIDELHECTNEYSPVEISELSTAILIYTSGTMGNQKGVMLSHQNIIENIVGGFTHISFNPGTSFLSLIPLSHMFGINGGFLAPLCKGAKVTYVKSLKGSEILKALNQSKAEILVLVPLILKKFYASIYGKVEQYSFFKRLVFNTFYKLAIGSANLGISLGKKLFVKIHGQMGGHLKFFISGGAPLEPDIEKFFNVIGMPILNGYGLTETSPIVSVNSFSNRKFGSVGKVIPGVEVMFTKDGEILVSGSTIMKGYFNDEEATRQVINNGWFMTGDIGALDKNGFLFIKDRIKNVIVLPSGLKIFPNEIELELGKSPLFIETCVVKRKTKKGEEPVVVIYPDNNLLRNLSEDEKQIKIRNEIVYYQKQLPSYKKVLDFIVHSSELPKTSTKKIRRKELEQQVNSQIKENKVTVTDNYILTEKEMQVAVLVKQFIKNSNAEINQHTNLSNDLGIDSIMKIELVSELENQFQVSIPDTLIYSIESFNDLMQAIQTETANIVARQDVKEPELIIREPGILTRHFSSFAICGFLKLFFKIELINKDQIPKAGAFIIAANHASMLDFPLLSAILPKEVRKRISVPAAYDYFYKKSFITWLFRAGFNMFPMKRYGNYFDGLKICANKIREGKPLIVFPEGTRSVSGKLQAFKPGIGYLAHELNVPIIPTYIKGAYEALPKGSVFPKPAKIQVILGDPIKASHLNNVFADEPKYKTYQKTTNKVRSSIEQMIKNNQ